MNQATYDRLRSNPHYKISERQKASIATEKRSSMIEIGRPPIHNQNLPIHETLRRRQK